ncbi:MAG TPA: 6-pyruvoyl-tetrahydropterin synthase-related protein [Terracidiphilus sp.]|nr:6-pyruvoyl-tetrahydropterin synthase-related protein [Terracidiphilus sp.]
MLAAALAVLPLMIRGTSCGHDFDFHLVSWIDVLHSWRHGIFYPRWAPSPNFNAGEPRFIFYPPLTWMLGAALGAVLPWTWVPVAMTFLLLASSGLATRALARQVLPDAAATLAGCIAIFSGYALYSAYERSALAELAGGFWIPLTLLLVLRPARAGSRFFGALDGSAVLLALVVAGAWLSNAPVGVMTCYLLAAFALIVSGMRREWTPVLRAAVGAALGLGLAAFYLVPAAVEQRWVAIRQAVDDPGEQIQNSFLFGRHADPQLLLHDVELRRVSWIAVGMLTAALLALLVSWRRRTLPGGRRWWVPLAIIPAVVLLLQLPLSLPVWSVLPKLRFLQFPWRWLVAVEAPLGIFVAAAVRRQGPRDRGTKGPEHSASLGWIVPIACGVVFLGLTVLAGRVFFQICDRYDAVPGMLQAYGDGGGYEGTDEYAPPGADDSLVAQDLPGACLVSDPAVLLGKTTADNPQPDWAPDQKSCVAAFNFQPVAKAPELHKRIQAAIPAAGYLVLRLRRYPAWVVRVSGAAVMDMPEREDGLIAAPVPAGPVNVTADWATTPDVRRGRWISVLALVFIAAIAAAARRRSGGQLK